MLSRYKRFEKVVVPVTVALLFGDFLLVASRLEAKIYFLLVASRLDAKIYSITILKYLLSVIAKLRLNPILYYALLVISVVVGISMVVYCHRLRVLGGRMCAKGYFILLSCVALAEVLREIWPQDYPSLKKVAIGFLIAVTILVACGLHLAFFYFLHRREADKSLKRAFGEGD